MRRIRPLAPLLVVGRGVRGYDAGEVWHLLDARVEGPPIAADSVGVGVEPGQHAGVRGCGRAEGRQRVVEDDTLAGQRRGANCVVIADKVTLSQRPIAVASLWFELYDLLVGAFGVEKRDQVKGAQRV